MTDPISVDFDTAAALAITQTQAVIANATALGLTWQLRLGTITQVNAEGSVADVAKDFIYALLDGDTEPIRVDTMSGSVSTDQRVYIIQVPPSGNFIIGTPGVSGSGGGGSSCDCPPAAALELVRPIAATDNDNLAGILLQQDVPASIGASVPGLTVPAVDRWRNAGDTSGRAEWFRLLLETPIGSPTIRDISVGDGLRVYDDAALDFVVVYGGIGGSIDFTNPAALSVSRTGSDGTVATGDIETYITQYFDVVGSYFALQSARNHIQSTGFVGGSYAWLNSGILIPGLSVEFTEDPGGLLSTYNSRLGWVTTVSMTGTINLINSCDMSFGNPHGVELIHWASTGNLSGGVVTDDYRFIGLADVGDSQILVVEKDNNATPFDRLSLGGKAGQPYVLRFLHTDAENWQLQYNEEPMPLQHKGFNDYLPAPPYTTNSTANSDIEVDFESWSVLYNGGTFVFHFNITCVTDTPGDTIIFGLRIKDGGAGTIAEVDIVRRLLDTTNRTTISSVYTYPSTIPDLTGSFDLYWRLAAAGGTVTIDADDYCSYRFEWHQPEGMV
jgi:hypothetical protein